MKFFSHYSPQEKNLKNKIYKENKRARLFAKFLYWDLSVILTLLTCNIVSDSNEWPRFLAVNTVCNFNQTKEKNNNNNNKAIPSFFSFTVKCVSWHWVGLWDWKKKTLKKNHKKSRNSRPWYPKTTSKVNIHIFGWTKCPNCKKSSCFCSCFSLCCYYAQFSD